MASSRVRNVCRCTTSNSGAKAGGDEERNLITLCAECHEQTIDTNVAFGNCDDLSGDHWVSGVRPLKRARILIRGLNEAQRGSRAEGAAERG